jgi:hypothetical protein
MKRIIRIWVLWSRIWEKTKSKGKGKGREKDRYSGRL